MFKKSDIQLAQSIIMLDLLRDKLYEELMQSAGSQTINLLRMLQNR